jgi:hypothetical protein
MGGSNALPKIRLGKFLRMFKEEIVVHQLVSSNDVRLLSTISNNCYFIVKGHKSYSSIRCFILHVVNLGFNGSLDAL